MCIVQASIFSMPATESPLKLQLNYSDVISTWEQMTARQQTADSGPSSAQPVHDELNTISSTQYQLPYHPSCMSAPSASTLSTISQSNNAPAYPSTATSSDTAMQASMMYGHMGTAVHDPMGQRCLSLPLVQAQGWPHQTAGEILELSE